jgi:predicted nucleotidyltransferase
MQRSQPAPGQTALASSTAQQIIGRMVERLATQFHPRRIILFGSWARGQQTPDSDVDLLVVMDEVTDRRALRVAMRRALGTTGLSKDIVLLTSAEFERQRQVAGSIAYPADREGRVLYAA